MPQSLQSDPPVGDVGMNGFLDAMRSEVKRAVADIRMELEEVYDYEQYINQHLN